MTYDCRDQAACVRWRGGRFRPGENQASGSHSEKGRSSQTLTVSWMPNLPDTYAGCEAGLVNPRGRLTIDIQFTGVHQEHWCWSGTNSKGKTGIFTRSHIEPGSLVEATERSDRSSFVSSEKKAGLLSRISMRHRSSNSGGFSFLPRGSYLLTKGSLLQIRDED